MKIASRILRVQQVAFLGRAALVSQTTVTCH